MIELKTNAAAEMPGTLPDDKGGFKPCPYLLTENDLIRFLRIPEISKAQNYHNVITHLRRYRNLPCIHICRQPLYPRQAVLRWIEETTQKEMAK